jgi:hypothetical protein
MDIYQIMARLDAIGSKKSLTESQDMMQPVAEGRFKELDIILQDYPEDVEEFKRSGDLGSRFYDALFSHYLDSGEMPYGIAKAREGDPYNWIVDRLSSEFGLDEAHEKLPADQLGLDKFSQAALAGGQRKRDALANPNQTRMLAKKSAQQRPVREAGEAFAKGDRVMYLNGFATVVSQDGDAYVVKVDGQPNTMKVPATAIKKPSYNEGVAKSKKAKRDFLDLDKDGNEEEPMKKAAKDKNNAQGSFQKQMGGSAKDLTKGLSIGAKKVSERHDKMDEAEMEEGNKFAHNVLKAKAAGIKRADLDGDGDMETVREMFPGTPEYELRFGKDDASSAFDKKKISTGTVYSRRYQDEPEADDDNDTPKKKGRPVGAKRRLGAKGPGVNSKLLKGKGGLKEQDIDIRDRGEYDREGDMALNQVHQIADAVEELHSILAADENLPEWVQAKITKALDYIDTSRDYLKAKDEQYTDRGQESIAEKSVSKAQQKFMGMVHAAKKGAKPASAAVAKVAQGMSGKDAEDFAATKHKGLPAKKSGRVEEENTDTRDQHAEKAGKKVTKDLEYDMKHKGKDDAKAEKAGKKVTRDIEYDDKKDKEKKVDETTVSGSVATGGDAPKKSKGGMQFGKGVYEGAIAESFDKKLGGILTEGMSVNVSTDDTGKKSISVNATDADADSLGQMLKMAGLFSSEGYSRTCESCHGIHEAGACQAEQVAEELANSPDEVYTNPDYMTQTLSGGLNGPKTTGQTTGPVVNRQDNRQGVMAEAERVVEQSESRLWNLYKQYEKK